jgi:adenine-specific DNA-methyltransferase
MKIAPINIFASLPPAIKAFKPKKEDFERFKASFKSYCDRIDGAESEENLKTHLMDFLKPSFSPNHLIEQQERIDFVIRTAGKNSPAAVLFETKRHANKADMISVSDCNRKAMHELILYYMRERSLGNADIQKLLICTEHEFFVFEASEFERTFFRNRQFHKDFQDWAAGKKSDKTTEFFYTQIAKLFIGASDVQIEATIFDLRDYKKALEGDESGTALLPLFKMLCPQNLLKKDLDSDSNNLNKLFYDELLHIIGLEERKEGPNRIIDRLEPEKRNVGSLLENAIARLRHEDGFNDPAIIQAYGTTNDERAFNIALELCLTWVNRLLFLKLLEAQVVKFHGGDANYRFLNVGMISDFEDMSDLFFMVLALKPTERPENIQAKYRKVPYLNSSLFEKSRLEQLLGIGGLNNKFGLPLFKNTILKTSDGRRREGKSTGLAYLLAFLDAYDFGSVGSSELREESKTIINAAVLGLIFEKINGYKEGAIFTPGYVTMYMSRKVIEKATLEAFGRENAKWQLNDIEDLRNNITDRSKASVLKLNSVIDGLKICDPAVGSGHFLVSCLNELIALKSRLGILADEQGNRLSDYTIEVDNDELIILKADSGEAFSYQVSTGVVPQHLQHVQKTIFGEKQKLIENCLFGVDINANSVHICQLRLWIELLKSAYYRDAAEGDLETLPNIDINIKCGNSLLSRFKLDQNLSDAFNKAKLTVMDYRRLVAEYKRTRDKAVKRALQSQIDRAKARFQEESLGNLKKRLDAEMASLKVQEAQEDLFVLGEEQELEKQKKLSEIREQISNLEARQEKLLQNRIFMSALEWRFEFPEVLDDKGNFVGFDIIIANPPYMRVQEIEATQTLQKEFYERDFSTARGSYDLANLFFELAMRLSKRNGNNNIFIFPHKLFNSANGASLREYLINTRAIKQITHFGANQVFDSAITYTCIALFNSRPTDTFRFKRFSLGDAFKNELANDSSYADLTYKDIATASDLYGNNQWIFFDEPDGFKAFAKMFAKSTSLSAKLSVFVGLQTSRDTLYVARKLSETKNHYTILVNPDGRTDKPLVATREFVVEKKFFRPFLMGKDVHRFQTVNTDRLVFFPYYVNAQADLVRIGDLKKNYPKTYDFVMANKPSFESREKGKAKKLKEWYAYIYEKNLTKFDQDKLISMEICSSHPNITINRSKVYHSTTVYSLASIDDAGPSYEFLLGVLNSRLFWWFLKSTGDTLQGDARRMKTNYINPFPMPETVLPKEQKRISDLVSALIVEKANLARAGLIVRKEAAINKAVYELYGFDEEDIDVVERAINPLRVSEEEPETALDI